MKRVMIVDDAMFMRKTIKKMLEKNGFEVVAEAKSGKEAIDIYKKIRPEIVTMDITMPEIDGIEALKLIREYDENAKVIMVSAIGQEFLVKESIVSGACGFVVKPFTEEFLISSINTVL